MTVRIVATDDQLDLIKERIDIAITIGTSPATTLVRQHLADWQNVLVAAPSYLKTRGTPRTASDLAGQDFLVLPHWHHAADALTGPGGERYRLSAAPRVVSNNQLTIRQLALAGCGLSLHVVPEIVDELASGRLVHVLPEWSLPTLSVDALMLPRAKQPSKVRAALAAIPTSLGGARGYAARRARR